MAARLVRADSIMVKQHDVWISLREMGVQKLGRRDKGPIVGTPSLQGSGTAI
jgi:hypothetical protein